MKIILNNLYLVNDLNLAMIVSPQRNLEDDHDLYECEIISKNVESLHRKIINFSETDLIEIPQPEHQTGDLVPIEDEKFEYYRMVIFHTDKMEYTYHTDIRENNIEI